MGLGVLAILVLLIGGVAVLGLVGWGIYAVVTRATRER